LQGEYHYLRESTLLTQLLETENQDPYPMPMTARTTQHIPWLL
jgi:hypothetical protein